MRSWIASSGRITSMRLRRLFWRRDRLFRIRWVACWYVCGLDELIADGLCSRQARRVIGTRQMVLVLAVKGVCTTRIVSLGGRVMTSVTICLYEQRDYQML